MFGSKRKQREAADSAAMTQAFSGWFDALTRARPPGASAVTDDLVRQVGSPYAYLGPRPRDEEIEFLTARYFGREWADRLSRKAVLEHDADARSRSRFWASVSNWL